MPTAQTAKKLIEKYFQACNDADRQELLFNSELISTVSMTSVSRQ